MDVRDLAEMVGVLTALIVPVVGVWKSLAKSYMPLFWSRFGPLITTAASLGLGVLTSVLYGAGWLPGVMAGTAAGFAADVAKAATRAARRVEP